MDVRAIQRALRAAGHKPGPIDGIVGRRTIEAVKAFQAARALDIKWPGTIGPKTIAALFGEETREPVPDDAAMPWLAHADSLVGTREAPGTPSNALIDGWAADLGLWYPDDSIAWCGLFVSHCIATTLPSERIPTNPLGARNWLKFGKTCKPQPGAVMVFWRGRRKGWKGHVGFCWGEDGKAYHILGGNQSNAVNVKRVAKSRFLGARWPATANPPAGAKRLLDARGRLSANEA